MATKERNWGIDLLRIICMLMIVAQHTIGHGWIMQQIHPDSWKYLLIRSLGTFTLFGVDGFAMISGYVSVNGRYRYTTLILQWLKVLLYSITFTLLMLVAAPDMVNKEVLIKGFFPAIKKQYWYFTAYIGCFMVAPLINAAMRQMNKRQAGACIASMLLIFSGLNLFDVDPFYVAQGKNTLWLIVLYAVGAYIARFGLLTSLSTKKLALVTALSVAVSVSIAEVTARVSQMLVGERLGYGYLDRSDSPTILLMSILLLLLFSRLRIKRGTKLLALLAPLNFSVYLIHDHPLIRRYTISRYAGQLANLSEVQLIPGILLAVMCIYAACALLDALREQAFRKLRLKERLLALEERLIGFIWD